MAVSPQRVRRWMGGLRGRCGPWGLAIARAGLGGEDGAPLDRPFGQLCVILLPLLLDVLQELRGVEETKGKEGKGLTNEPLLHP